MKRTNKRKYGVCVSLDVILQLGVYDGCITRKGPFLIARLVSLLPFIFSSACPIILLYTPLPRLICYSSPDQLLEKRLSPFYNFFPKKPFGHHATCLSSTETRNYAPVCSPVIYGDIYFLIAAALRNGYLSNFSINTCGIVGASGARVWGCSVKLPLLFKVSSSIVHAEPRLVGNLVNRSRLPIYVTPLLRFRLPHMDTPPVCAFRNR